VHKLPNSASIGILRHESSAASCILQYRRTCGSHPAADCSISACHRAALQSPSQLSSSQLLHLTKCYRAAFSTAPFQRCAQLHCRRRQPPAASTLHTHRAACRTPNPATSHHTHPKRMQIGGNAAHSATPAAIVRRCSSRRRLFTCHHSAHSSHKLSISCSSLQRLPCQTASADIC